MRGVLMGEDLKIRIFNIVKKHANIDLTKIDPEKDFREQVSIDSMQFVSIVARLEEELGIELPISIMEVSTLNEFLSVIEKELHK